MLYYMEILQTEITFLMSFAKNKLFDYINVLNYISNI